MDSLRIKLMNLKKRHLNIDVWPKGQDPWTELQPVTIIARLIGQGWSNRKLIKIYTLVIAAVEILLPIYWINCQQVASESTLNRLTEAGQVIIIYLTASWSGLTAVFQRRDDEIMTILKLMPVTVDYCRSNACKKIALKLTLLMPFIVFNLIFSEDMVYDSNWNFTTFFFPLTQLIIAQLQMTITIDMLTKMMDKLIEELPKCIMAETNFCTKCKQYSLCSGHGKLFSKKRLATMTPQNLCHSSNTLFSEEVINPDRLTNLIKGHALLQEALAIVNSSFGLQTLASLGRTFIVVTFNSFLFIHKELIYHICVGDYIELIKHSFSLLAIVAIHLYELKCLVSSAERFTSSAEKFSNNLYVAAIEDSTQSLAVKDEVKCHIASGRNSTITAYGFINLEHSLICSMLGAITTYIIIIIQIGNQ